MAQTGDFPRLQSQGGAPLASKHTKGQLQASKRTNPLTGVLGNSSWAESALPSWEEAEPARTRYTCLPPNRPAISLSAKLVISISGHSAQWDGVAREVGGFWHLRSLLENNFCCHDPAWGYNSITKGVFPSLPKDQRVCPALPGLWAGEPSRDSWSTVSPSPRRLLPCCATAPHLPIQEER